MMVRTSFPAWLIGVGASTGAVIGVAVAVPGLLTSPGGLAILAVAALAAGTAASGIAAPDDFGRNITIVAFYIVVLAAFYSLMLSAAHPEAPGARGGPAVYPPQRGGGPGTYPPLR